MKRLFFGFCYMLCTTFVCAATWTDPETNLTWIYTVSDGKAIVGNGLYPNQIVSPMPKDVLIIPSQIAGLDVVAISHNALTNGSSGYASPISPVVVIPYGVTSIGRDAFRWCEELKEIVLPDSVKAIENGAFSECSSLDITLPNASVQFTGQPFAGCKTVRIPEQCQFSGAAIYGVRNVYTYGTPSQHGISNAAMIYYKHKYQKEWKEFYIGANRTQIKGIECMDNAMQVLSVPFGGGGRRFEMGGLARVNLLR